MAVARELRQVADQGVAIGVDEARQAVGQPGVERAVAGEEALIEQADVEFGIGIVHLDAFVGGAHGVAHAQAGVPQMLEECGDGLLGGRDVPVGREQQQQIDVGVREELPPAVAAHREQATLDATPGNSRRSRGIHHQAVHFGGTFGKRGQGVAASPGIAGGCATHCC